MMKIDIVSSYLTKVTQVRYMMVMVGETISDEQLFGSSMSGFSRKWNVFIDPIVSREHLPDRGNSWDDFQQEEIRKNVKSSVQHGKEDEQNDFVIVNGEGKGKVNGVWGSSSQMGMRKVKFFARHKANHYAIKYLYKKKKKEEQVRIVVVSFKIYDIPKNFEK